MVDPSPNPEAHENTGLRPEHASSPGTPGWVKALVIIAIGLVVVMVILHLSGLNLMNHMPLTH